MSDKKGKVLIAAPVHEMLIDGLAEQGYTCDLQEQITQHTAPGLIKDCVGVVTSTRLQLDKALIDSAPHLRWIGRMGSGMEVIDVLYAREKGIACFSSPEGNCNAVGEHALGMLLDLNRRITVSNNEMKQGIWLRNENRGTELEGKTIGIIGFGHTGQAFAKKLLGFDMEILVYDKYNANNVPESLKNCNSLTPIFERADIISFHVPLQEDTIHYFNEAFVLSMKKKFILINTSRGVVVDTTALYRGIKEGKIRGACLDVFEEEPLSAMNVAVRGQLDELMLAYPLVVTPHIAGYTFEALYKMSKALLYKIIAV